MTRGETSDAVVQNH